MQIRKLEQKLIDPSEIHYWCLDKRYTKRTIVFTNGCFDLLHSGHVLYLEAARRLGDFLVVGVNSDASVKRLKGKGRPVNSLEDRMTVLAGLQSVDAVTWFEEDNPEALIELVIPDVHAKGGDYKLSQIPEARLVKKLGGRVEILPLVPGRSTTETLERFVKKR